MTDGGHPEPRDFLRVLQGEAPPPVVRHVVRHLVEGCERCSRAMGSLQASAAELPAKAQEAGNDPYGAVLDRVTRRVIRHKQSLQSAQVLQIELMSHPAVEGLGQIHSTRRYATLALCELLLKKARSSWVEGSGLEEDFIRLAAGVAEQLDLEVYGAQAVPDLRAAPWAYLVNAHRMQADLKTAESTLRLVHQLEQCRGPRRRDPELLSLSASLRFDQGRFDDAGRWLNRLASIHRRAADLHLQGRATIRKASVWANLGRTSGALRLLRRGCSLIEPRKEPRLVVYATHALLWFLSELGEHEEAKDTASRARHLYRERNDRSSLARLRWLEGKVARSRGDVESAEEIFTDARVRLARAGLGYEAALASMDLAFLYAYQGRADRMRRQAEQMMPLFKSQEMYGETLVALKAYRRHEDARGQRRRPEELARAVEGYLGKMRRRKNTLRLPPPPPARPPAPAGALSSSP